MRTWLAPILGVVVIGVVVELLTAKSRMGKFIRSLYAFLVLFVIVQPLPKLIQNLQNWQPDTTTITETSVTNALTQQSRQAQIKQQLLALGYADALVWVQGDAVYVNVGCPLDDAARQQIKIALGNEELYLI